MVQSALAPLGPVYAHDLHLTRVQVGSLFAASSATMLLTALPIGLVTDRLGAKRLTVASALLVAASALGQGVARDFWLPSPSRSRARRRAFGPRQSSGRISEECCGRRAATGSYFARPC